MKIVMTLLVRNEDDIIRENIEYHLSQGVSFFVVTDNLSVDGTSDILKEYEAKGVLRYMFEESNQFDQHEWVTQMAIMAYTEYGADWVINNDADEFWWPTSGSLVDVFKRIPKEFNTLQVDRSNFVMVEERGTPFHERMIYRTAVSLNSLGRPLPPKIAHRGSANIRVAPGNHKVSGLDKTTPTRAAIKILHFPMRSYQQFESKIKLGGAAYERNTTLPVGVGVTWRKLYSELQSKSDLREYYARNTYDAKRIQEETNSGQIIEDHSFSDYLSLLPRLQRNLHIK